jgi:hypothetical protein
MTMNAPTAMTIGWSADIMQMESEEGDDVKKLIFHSNDFTTSPIVDNPKVCCHPAKLGCHPAKVNCHAMLTTSRKAVVQKAVIHLR